MNEDIAYIKAMYEHKLKQLSLRYDKVENARKK